MGIIISYLLRIGVITSAIITLTGGIFFLVWYGNSKVAHGVFHGEPIVLRSISGIISAALSGNFRAIMQLGLLVLIATPVVRVGFSVLAFFLERDYLYVFITLAVFIILISSYIIL